MSGNSKHQNTFNANENISNLSVVLLPISKIRNQNAKPNYFNKMILFVLKNNCFHHQERRLVGLIYNCIKIFGENVSK